MNPWQGAAAVAAFSTFLIHLVVGGRRSHARCWPPAIFHACRG